MLITDVYNHLEQTGTTITTDGLELTVTPPPPPDLAAGLIQWKWVLIATICSVDRCARCNTTTGLIATYWGPDLCPPCRQTAADHFDHHGWPPDDPSAQLTNHQETP